MSILEVSGLRKVYTTRFGGSWVEALRNVQFTVEQGEYVAIMGESGSGKTTLLNILAALDEPTAGTVRLDGHELGKIREKDAASFRRDNLGFVFQEFNLLDTFTLRDNIYLPLVLAGRPYRELKARLDPIARQLGILELLDKYPYEVSGGPLLLAAGELGRVGVGLIGQAHHFQQLLGALFGFLFLHTCQLHGEADVLQAAALHQQVELLKDHPNTAPGLPELLFR